MAGNRRWTDEEDQAIRDAAMENRVTGKGVGGRGRRNSRLRAVAATLGRSYGAVKNRAIRIGAYARQVGRVSVKQAESQGAVAAR